MRRKAETPIVSVKPFGITKALKKKKIWLNEHFTCADDSRDEVYIVDHLPSNTDVAPQRLVCDG
jgi:hypothetical protein